MRTAVALLLAEASRAQLFAPPDVAAPLFLSAQHQVQPDFKPYGVNLGGWLNLEDWFFSGDAGRYVMTKGTQGQGACLPPLLTSVDEPWPSEGILVHRLVEKHGFKETVDVFEAHRHSFIEESDLRKIADLGTRMVRLPLNWAAFADALAPISSVYARHNPANESAVVPDPFYANTSSFVTVQRDWLEELLVRGHRHGLQFVLDMHALPGGHAAGTYNGVWPQHPRFWNSNSKIGDTSVSLQEAGLMIIEGMLRWSEGLTGEARDALGGMTLMNEPACMAYLNGWQPPFATPTQILAWLGKATKLFLASQLPRRGVKLYMNLHESAFPTGQFYEITTPWWHELVSREERQTVAVFDVHFYISWLGKTGAVGTLENDVKARCDQPLSDLRGVFRNNVQAFADQLSARVDGLKSCTEFSAGTNEDAVLACNDQDLTNTFIMEEVEAMHLRGIPAFFWTWKMPYGPAFERGWSLKVNARMGDSPAPHACGIPGEEREPSTAVSEGAASPRLALRGAMPEVLYS